MKRLPLLLLALSVKMALAAPVFSPSALKKYSAGDPAAIFTDPKIACYLTALLGAKKLAAVKESMQNQEMRPDPDSSGAFLFPGSVSGLNGVAEAMIALHPEGRIWVAYLNDGKAEYFTNDKATFLRPPPALKEWNTFGGAWKPMSSDTDKFSEKATAQCSDAKLADAIKRFESRANGTLCDAGRTFSETAIVTAKPGEKVAFKTGKAYLVEGDLVQLAFPYDPKQTHVCALYRADSQAKRAGELPLKSLTTLSEKLMAARATVSAGELSSWVGTWDGVDSQLVVGLAGQQLTATGSATSGANVGEITNQLFDVTGASALPAKTQGKDTLVCEGLKLYRFNNALYVSETGQCGGRGVRFDGVHFKARPVAKKK